MPRSFEHELVGGVAEFLTAADLASWDEFGEGTYTTADEWPTFIGPNMPTSPDRVIVLTPGVQSVVRFTITQMIQVRLRGLPGAIAATSYHSQRIRDAFTPNGLPLASTLLGSIRVGLVQPGDVLPLDLDGNRRPGSIFNLRIRARRPGSA